MESDAWCQSIQTNIRLDKHPNNHQTPRSQKLSESREIFRWVVFTGERPAWFSHWIMPQAYRRSLTEWLPISMQHPAIPKEPTGSRQTRWKELRWQRVTRKVLFQVSSKDRNLQVAVTGFHSQRQPARTRTDAHLVQRFYKCFRKGREWGRRNFERLLGTTETTAGSEELQKTVLNDYTMKELWNLTADKCKVTGTENRKNPTATD